MPTKEQLIQESHHLQQRITHMNENIEELKIRFYKPVNEDIDEMINQLRDDLADSRSDARYFHDEYDESQCDLHRTREKLLSLRTDYSTATDEIDNLRQQLEEASA